MVLLRRRQVLMGSAALAGSLGVLGQGSRAQAGAIRIGEINSYSGIPAFTIPYRQGWQLAVEQVNAAGGVMGGRLLEVISRDDNGSPADALTAANELVTRERVQLLAGTFLSNVGLAVADFARQNEIYFMAAEPLTDALTLSQGNRYTFRLRPSTYMQAAMLVEEAAQLEAVRWAVVAPNYEYGTSAVAAFKALMSARRPDVEWVVEQFPALNQIDAGSTVEALEQGRPDAIFNVTFGSDLIQFVREGNTRGLFEGRDVVSLLTGEPEYLDPLEDEAPEGWIVTGYPWYDIDTPEHQAFLEAYEAKFEDYPRLGSVVGYNTFLGIAAALDAAASTDVEDLITATRGVEFDSPCGRLLFRGIDHQATMGAWVGRTALRDGRGVMVDWRYADGSDFLVPEERVLEERPEEARA